MEFGKREAPKMRRAADGSVEWRCSKCFLFKPIAMFVKIDERRGYVCLACDSLEKAGHRNTEAFVLDPLLVAPCKPVNTQLWERAVWRHVRKHLEPFAAGPEERKHILRGIKAWRKAMLKKHRVGLIELLASDDLKRPEEYFWLVFRKGFLDMQTLRLFAIGVAKYAATLSGLYTQDPQVEEVLFEARHIVNSLDGSMKDVRQMAYGVLERLQREYNPQPMYKAAMALTGVCFPNPYEAALATTGWGVETWLALKGLLIQTEANLLDRQKAIQVFLKDLTRLMRVLAQACVEDRAQYLLKQRNKYVTGAVDYDLVEE